MHRHILSCAGLIMLAACSPGADQASGDGGGQALVGATVIDGTGGPAIANGVVLVSGDRIECVGQAVDCPVPSGAHVTQLNGQFVTPGLVDAHVHFMQTGWLDGRPDGAPTDAYPYDETARAVIEDPGRWHRAFLCSGITAVYDVGGQDWSVTGEHTTDTDRPDRVHVRAAGPLITHAGPNEAFMVGTVSDLPVFLPMQSSEDIQDSVAHLVSIGSQAVKVWYLAPAETDRERLDALLMEAGEAAAAAGLPLIVHATSLREAKVALRAGAAMLVHSVEDEPVDQEFLDLLLANDAVYAPTLVVGGFWREALISASRQEVFEIDDPNGCVDAALRERIAHPERFARLQGRFDDQQVARIRVGAAETLTLMQANLLAVHEAGGRIATATDSGNPLTLHGPSIYAEMEAMQAAGLSPDTIIELSTRGGASAMGQLDAFGTLEAGKLADLIVLAEDPRDHVSNFRTLTHVMRAGVLSEQADLRVYPASGD